MELQFEKQPLSCLKSVLRQVQTQEQTQEVRVSDGMPDIGSVLGAWGQVILRSKQWQDGEASINGGVMVWVLYRPEDGGTPCSVESWIPFQMRWEQPKTERDGTLQVSTLLHSVDARNTSARKFMLRTNVSTLLQSWEPYQADIYKPGELPVDIQLKKMSYPVTLPAEAGEKSFTIEETLSVGGAGKPEKLIAYHLQPEVLDKKVMTDKIVFRGSGLLHLLYQGTDGDYYSVDLELPFSQYTQLDSEYEEDTATSVLPAVTSLEAELEEGQVKVKAGMVCQYTICPRTMVEVVEDAYSPIRQVEPVIQQLHLPVILEFQRKTLPLAAELDAQGSRVIDVSFWPDQAEIEYGSNSAEVLFPGMLQMLYYNAENQLDSAIRRVQQSVQLPMETDSRLAVTVQPTGSPHATLGMNARIQAEILTDFAVFGENGIPMVSGLAVGEEVQPDPNRPSLILRKAGSESLWNLAKKTGTTVEAIKNVNSLDGEPSADQILLIPVP